MLSLSSLTDEENYRYVWIMRSYVNLYENLHEQFKDDTCAEPFWQKHALELKASAGTPGLKMFREQYRFHEELFTYLNEVGEETENFIALKLQCSE